MPSLLLRCMRMAAVTSGARRSLLHGPAACSSSLPGGWRACASHALHPAGRGRQPLLAPTRQLQPPAPHVSFATDSKDDASAADSDRAASGAQVSTSGGGSAAVFTLPTILTLARVAAIPVLIAVWYWASSYSAMASTIVFAVASLTDWLDGYLARKMNAHSAFGAFLDPVADKLMVAAVLILLCTQPIPAGPLAGNAWLIPVMTLAIIGREITMSALREWAATAGPEARSAVAVNSWGKWKTATQMTSLTLLLLCKDGGSGALVEFSATAGPALLVVASWLTVHSLTIYMGGLWKHFSRPAGGAGAGP